MRPSRALLALLLLVAPPAYAQAEDPAQVALGPADVDGWTPSMATRDETWDITASSAADVPSNIAWYETQFTRAGGQQRLTTRATLARSDLADAYFQNVRHNALGQTPIPSAAIGNDALGWRERDTAAAVARVDDLTLELHLTGLTDTSPVTDDQVAAWLSRLLERAGAPRDTAVDWSQLLPDQPHAWAFVLDASQAGNDWQQQTGLELSSHDSGGKVTSVSAAREFSRTGAYRRSLTSVATVFDSSDAAVDAMSSSGTPIDAPTLGDATFAFRESEAGEGHNAPTITYTVDVRRGNLVMSTQETGVAASLDSPSEVFALATALDAHSAEVLSP